MSLSYGPACDYLVALARQAVSGIRVNSAPVLVIDGVTTVEAFGMFFIGTELAPPDLPTEATGDRAWTALGAQSVEENYTIPCLIDVRDGETQKQVRDDASAIFDAFWPLLKADLTLGGVLTGGRWAEISNLTFVPSPVGGAAENGHRQTIAFGVHCRSKTS